MCGICGIVDYGHKERLDAVLLEGMIGRLAHRGPDDRGVKLFAGGGPPRAGLAHSRLSIIDLSPRGHEPMPNEDGTLWLVYNGEIFNFKDLKAGLQARGHRFSSHTDSEVIIHAYEEYGKDCVGHFRGQFAFALWDIREKTLFLARDHTGIKPLYYYFRNGRFIFASELKAILECPDVPRDIDPLGLAEYLTYEFVPHPRTILKEIVKLPPAHHLTFRNGEAAVARYWDVDYNPVRAGEEELARRLEELLFESVKGQLISDVPLGAFLSGGLDSSTVVALMSRAADGPVKTFSIGFEDRSYNELAYAREVASRFGTQHREFIIRPQAVELAGKLVEYLDDPIADFSVFPTYLVSSMAGKYVTVALTGDGGDEIFAGYDTYLAHRMAASLGAAGRMLGRAPLKNLVSAIPPSDRKKGALNRLKRFSEGMALPGDLEHFRWMIFFSSREREQLFADEYAEAACSEDVYDAIRGQLGRRGAAHPLNRQLYADLKTYLTDNCLVKTDRMSMACSLEVRVPLLDHKIIEFMASVPPDMKLRGFTRKYLLRKAVSGLLPPRILQRGKEGFSIPMKNWLKNELKTMMRDLLSEAAVRKRGYFRPRAVSRLVGEHLGGKANHSHKLWALMLFEQWARRFLD